jgi:hypothetical protein
VFGESAREHHVVAGRVAINVREGSALVEPADVLILKHAQRLYGVDARAVEAAGLNAGLLPAEGDCSLFTSPSRLVPKNLLFVGVPPLRHFGYREIREFARRGLEYVARELPDARSITLTLHGANYGLDEIEAFEAELAGLLEVLGSDASPPALSTITFVERQPNRAERMRNSLAALVPAAKASPLVPEDVRTVREDAADRLRSVGYDSGTRRHALVAMPFGESFDDRFYFGISQPVRSAGLLCERADQQTFTGDVLQWLMGRIRTASLVVADLTDSNPNVYLEVGFAWGCNTSTILVCSKDSELLFDVRGQRVLRYGSIKELYDLLSKEIPEILRREGV